MYNRKAFLLIGLLSIFDTASAAMTISGTRIIFPAKEKEQIIRTSNKGKQPALIQVWVDDGSTNKDINQMKVPFLVTPPVYRVEPNKGQSVRLIYNGMALPKDRESVFWFNMMEIPPVDKEKASRLRLELAFNTRIKIFYRPEGLTSSSAHEVNKLSWEMINNNKTKGVKIINPTPYYFSFDSGYVTTASGKKNLKVEMIPPLASKVFPFEKSTGSIEAISQGRLRLLNDYGAAVEVEFKYDNKNKPVIVVPSDNNQ
ncbi:fimbrial biogenesis chaperone [[Erwinia] mediterraneensis]|uniref:fimbrial biogenesis chaperone n=1 Tax=[Erwinia] mediterraneensis TaxID=2161819 RepID=UPI00102F8EAC|nr:fimbria/pilus periplasmic chaperone [[Erwinia] mediterraneensis]